MYKCWILPCLTLLSYYLLVPDVQMLVPAMPDPPQFQLLSTEPECWIFYLQMTQPVVQPRDVVLGQTQVDAQRGRGGGEGYKKY